MEIERVILYRKGFVKPQRPPEGPPATLQVASEKSTKDRGRIRPDLNVKNRGERTG